MEVVPADENLSIGEPDIYLAVGLTGCMEKPEGYACDLGVQLIFEGDGGRQKAKGAVRQECQVREELRILLRNVTSWDFSNHQVVEIKGTETHTVEMRKGSFGFLRLAHN